MTYFFPRKFFSSVLREIYEWIDILFQIIPGFLGIYLRRFYISLLTKQISDISVGRNVSIRGFSGITFGKSVFIGDNCKFSACSNGSIVVGDNCSFAAGCALNADIDGFIHIGSHTLLGPDCYLRASNHGYEQLVAPRYQKHIPGVIDIKHSCWCGARVVMLSGSSIPPFSVVAAGAVVNKSFSVRSLLAGVPAKVIKYL